MDASKERTYIVPEQFRLLAAMAMPTDEESRSYRKNQCVAVYEDGDKLHYHVTDGRVAAALTIPKEQAPEAPDGRFPDLAAVVPKSPMVAEIRIDPMHLRKALDLASASDPDNIFGMMLEYRGDDRPLVIRAGHPMPGCGLICLVMPMQKPKPGQ